MKKFSFLFLSMILAISCSQKERNFTLLEISELVRKGDPEVKTVLGKDMDAGISCKTYGPGCLSARRMMVRKVDMGVVEFENPEQARVVAKKIDQYYLGNWLFDDVVNEPVLEDLALHILKARRPALEKEN